jgi:hypothetical protein
MNSRIRIVVDSVVTLVLLYISASHVNAQDDVCSVAVPRQVLCDDFSDGNPFDGSPVRWEVSPGTDRIFIEDGDLHVTTTVPSDDHAVGRVADLWMDDMSVRTQGRILANGEGETAVAIYGRHEFWHRTDAWLRTFWGVVLEDGTVAVGGHGTGGQWTYAESITDLAPRDEVFLLHLTCSGPR